MAKLEIIVASSRPGRVGPTVARWIDDATRANGGFEEVELVDRAEVNLPFMNEPHHPPASRAQRGVEHGDLSRARLVGALCGGRDVADQGAARTGHVIPRRLSPTSSPSIPG